MTIYHLYTRSKLLQGNPLPGKGSITLGTLMAIIILINCPASFSFSLKCSNVVWQRTTYITLEAIASFGKILPPWQARSTIFEERDSSRTGFNKEEFAHADVNNLSSISLLNIDKAGNYSSIRDYEENNYLAVPLLAQNTTSLKFTTLLRNSVPPIINNALSSPTALNEPANENSRFMPNVFATVSSAASSVTVKPIVFLWDRIRNQIGSATQVVQNNVAAPTDDYGVYVPKGLFGIAARLVRRRVLNILDRSPTNWAHALSQDGDSVVRNLPAIYVSRSEQRFSMNRRAVSVGNTYDDKYDSSQTKLGRIATIRRFFSSVRQDISNRLGGGDSSKVEAEFNIFGGLMLTPKEVNADSSTVATKTNRSKASEVITSASTWFRKMVLRRSGPTLTNISSGGFVSDYQNKVTIASRQSGEFKQGNFVSLRQEIPNVVVNPLMGAANDWSGMFKGATQGALSIFQNVQLEIDRRLQLKADDSSRNTSIVELQVDSKEVTVESFRNLVQAGAEMADFSRSRILKSLGVNEESKLLQKEFAEKDDAEKFRWPWEVFYRAEIPFFETVMRSSIIETEEDSKISTADNAIDVSPQESYSDLSSSWNDVNVMPISNNVPTQIVKKEKIDKHILQKLLQRIFRIFPLATFIFGSLISILLRPLQRKVLDEDNTPKKQTPGILAWQPTAQNDGFNMDDLKYNPSAATNVPFPLITENVVGGVDNGAVGLLKSSTAVGGPNSQVLTSLDIPPRLSPISSTDNSLAVNAPMPFLPSTTLSNAPVNNMLDTTVNDALDNVGRENSIRTVASSIFTSATAQIFSIAAIAMNDVANLLKSEQRQQKIQSQPLVMIQASSIPVTLPTSSLGLSSPNAPGEVRSSSTIQVDVFGPSESASMIGAGQRTQEALRAKPAFIDKNRNPLPTKADFAYIKARQVSVAIQAALNVQSEDDVNSFLRDFGLKLLMSAIIDDTPTNQLAEKIDKLDVVRGVCRLTREKKSVAGEVARNHLFIGALCDLMEAPLKRFELFQSQTDRDYNQVAQKEAVALMQRMIRSSDIAVNHLRNNTQLYSRLMKCFDQIIEQETLAKFRQNQQQKNSPSSVEGKGSEEDALSLKAKSLSVVKKKKNSTTIVEYKNLKVSQMSRVASWGLGGVQWRPKLPGQKGLRILSLDGGGTRGVLSISYLKEIFKQSATSKQPHEFFDIICGTSTGGIIAVMLGSQRLRLPETEALYDRFIDRVFGQKSNIKLVTEQAFYDETELENVLYEIVKDDLMLDSNQNDCCRVFCISTKVNNNPPQTQVWRNYNYPPGQTSRYPGAFRVNTLTAVRATTAAPTFFTPVQWEGGLFCDGALVANNPTAIALQEAKVLYPGVPVELVVSIGTGYIDMGGSYLQSMGWDLLVNNLIASSTNTEDVHALLVDFLPRDKYFRFNPQLRSNLAIDEKNKSILTELKQLARDDFQAQLNGPNNPFLQQLFKTLRGDGT